MTAGPEPSKPTRFDWSSVAILAAALAGAAAVLWSTAPWGAGLDNDVVDFFSGAESLLDGRGYVQSNGEPFALWPPLMPTLLAAARALGLPFELTLRLMHPLALVALVWTTASLVRRVSGSPCIAVGAALVLSAAPVLFESWVMGLSEGLFVTFAVAAVLSLERFLDARTRTRFALCVLFTALTFLQRYLGVTLVAALSLVLLFAPRSDTWFVRLRRTAVFGALSVAPMVVWCLRTRAQTGHLTGNRGTIPGPELAVIAELTWRTFVGWIWPGASDQPIAQAVAALVIVVLGAALLWPSRRPDAPVLRRWAPLAAFPLVYFTLSSYLNYRWEIDGIGDRQLVPLAPFAVLFAALGFAAIRARLAGRGARAALDALGAIAIVAHLFAAASHLSGRIAFWRAEGPGVYATRSARDSAFADLVREYEFEGAVDSNDPHAVYYLARHYARMAPRRPGGYRKLGQGQRTRELAPTLVWFNQNERAVPPLDELRRAYDIAVLAQAPGGAIYRITPR